MTAHTPIPTRPEHNASRWAAEDAAEEALARFRAKWPLERTRDLAAAIGGDEAAGLRIAARSLDRNSTEPVMKLAVEMIDQMAGKRLSDAELRAHAKAQNKFVRDRI